MDISQELAENSLDIVRELGTGGFAIVYLANEKHLERQVAVKVINHLVTDPHQAKRFKQEVQALNRLHHENIAGVFRCGVLASGRPYVVMEYIPGESLRTVLTREKTLDCGRVTEIGLQLCAALREAHNAGIAHRDLKPENICLVESDGRTVLKLLDFGLSRDYVTTDNKNLTQSGTLVGTPSYMSPEQCLGQAVDARSDIYSFGCLLFEMMVGQAPFAGFTPMEIVSRQVQEPLPRLEDLAPHSRFPKDFCQLIRDCTAKQPDDRPQNIDDILQRLQVVAATNSRVKVRPEELQWHTKKTSALSKRAIIIACTLAVGLAIGIGSLFVIASKNEPSAVPSAENGRAELITGIDLCLRKRYSEALPHLQRAEQALQNIPEQEHKRAHARALSILVQDALKKNATLAPRAEPLLGAVLGSGKERDGHERDRYYWSVNQILAANQPTDQAITTSEECAAYLKTRRARSPYFYLGSLIDLGSFYRVAGKYQKSIAVFNEVKNDPSNSEMQEEYRRLATLEIGRTEAAWAASPGIPDDERKRLRSDAKQLLSDLLKTDIPNSRNRKDSEGRRMNARKTLSELE